MMRAMVVSAALVAMSGTVAFAQAAECSLATLKGRYIYHTNGIDASGKAYGEAGMEVYDGAGNFVSTSLTTRTGKLGSVSGTYTVSPDCTAEAQYPDAVYTYFLSADGSRFTWVSHGGNSNAGDEIRVGD